MLLVPSGKSMAGEGTTNLNVGPTRLLRLHAAGPPDATFSTGGLSQVAAGFSQSNPMHIHFTADGKILVGNGVSLLRLNPDGTRDTSFVWIYNRLGIGMADFAVQPDGGILVAGYFDTRISNHAGSFYRLQGDTESKPYYETYSGGKLGVIGTDDDDRIEVSEFAVDGTPAFINGIVAGER